MTADAIQIAILILLFLMESCATSAGVSKRYKMFPVGHAREDSLYAITFVKFHKLCSNCDLRDNNFRNLVVFLGGTNPMVNRRNLRYVRRNARKKIKSVNFLDEKYFIRRVPFITPIENLLQSVNYQLRKYLYGTESQRNTELEETGVYKKQNPRQKTPTLIKGIKLQTQVASTLAPTIRNIRSTVTERLPPTTPTLPVHTHTTSISHTKIISPDVNVLTNLVNTPYVTTSSTRSTKKSSQKPDASAAELYSPTTQTVPSSSRILETAFIEKIPILQQTFAHAIDQFERKYYAITLSKLYSISPADRRENGISFVESGLFLFLILNALAMEVDNETRAEIYSCLALDATDEDKMKLIKYVLDELPPSSEDLKFRWSTRLVVNGTWHPHPATQKALRLHLDRLVGDETPEQLMKKLNHMVEHDSGGAMRNTFEEDELADGARAVMINTMYVRARWRTAPTLLNGTRKFCDADGAPQRTTRMIRINDVMRYTDLPEWDAQAVEISYATPGLRLLLLVPRGRSLRLLTEHVSNNSLNYFTSKMRPLRVAITLPIYTLRMTLLLPNKLQAMGISRLVDPLNDASGQNLRLSHAVQRLMFWAEAGRNAFKDDGIEWDEQPQMEMMVDRPYIFYVRWRNLTLLNGNFVL